MNLYKYREKQKLLRK